MSILEFHDRKRLIQMIKNRNVGLHYNYLGEPPKKGLKENRSVTTKSMVRLKILSELNPEVRQQIKSRTSKKCVCGARISRNHYWAPKDGEGEWLVLGSTCSKKNNVSTGTCIKCFSNICCDSCENKKKEGPCHKCTRRLYCEECDTKPKEFYRNFTMARRADTTENVQYFVNLCLTLNIHDGIEAGEEVVKFLGKQLKLEGFSASHEEVETHYSNYVHELEKQRQVWKEMEEKKIREYLEDYVENLSDEDREKVRSSKLREQVHARFASLEMSKEEVKKVVKPIAKAVRKEAKEKKRVQLEKEREDKVREILKARGQEAMKEWENIIREYIWKSSREEHPDIKEEDRVILESLDNESLSISMISQDVSPPDPPQRQCECGARLSNSQPLYHTKCIECFKKGQQQIEWKLCGGCKKRFRGERWKKTCTNCWKRDKEMELEACNCKVGKEGHFVSCARCKASV